jgi:hypothetical protein
LKTNGDTINNFSNVATEVPAQANVKEVKPLKFNSKANLINNNNLSTDQKKQLHQADLILLNTENSRKKTDDKYNQRSLENNPKTNHGQKWLKARQIRSQVHSFTSYAAFLGNLAGVCSKLRNKTDEDGPIDDLADNINRVQSVNNAIDLFDKAIEKKNISYVLAGMSQFLKVKVKVDKMQQISGIAGGLEQLPIALGNAEAKYNNFSDSIKHSLQLLNKNMQEIFSGKVPLTSPKMLLPLCSALIGGSVISVTNPDESNLSKSGSVTRSLAGALSNLNLGAQANNLDIKKAGTCYTGSMLVDFPSIFGMKGNIKKAVKQLAYSLVPLGDLFILKGMSKVDDEPPMISA